MTASGFDSYDDRSTVMGYSYPDAPRRGLNAVHRLAVGMFTVTKSNCFLLLFCFVHPSFTKGNTLEVAPGFSGSLKLSALHSPDTDANPLVKVRDLWRCL